MIVHMCKLQVVTLDEQFERLVEGLQQLGYLHIEPVPLSQTPAAGVLHRMQLTEADRQRRQVLAEARRSLDELRSALGSWPATRDTSPVPPRGRETWSRMGVFCGGIFAPGTWSRVPAVPLPTSCCLRFPVRNASSPKPCASGCERWRRRPGCGATAWKAVTA
jgi:hypothetical protein